MKQRFTKLLAAVALLVFMMPSLAGWGQTRSDVTTTFKNKTSGSWQDGMTLPCENGGLDWVTSKAPASFESASPARGLQWSKVSTDLTTTITDASVTKVVVVASTNANANVNSISVYVGDNQIGSTQNMPKENNKTYTFETTTGKTGEIKVSMSNDGSKSTYIKSIAVTYTTGGVTTFDVNIANNITGGSILASPTSQEAGQSVTLTATPNSAYTFNNIAANWSVTYGDETVQVTTGDNNTATFEMPESDVTVSATFTAKPTHSITIASGIENGSVTASPESAYEGQTVTLTVTPNPGYELTNITVEDQSGNNVELNGYTFVMPNSNVVVNATFDLIPTTVSDELNREFTGVTSGAGYSSWSNKTGVSGAVYSGNSAGGNDAIQLRSSDNSGIISTTSGGKLRAVKVTWNDNTADGRTMDVYGSNTAYTATSNLYGNDSQGTKLGAIVYGTSTELTITGNYKYIGIRSKSGAMYLDEIEIQWVPSTDPSISAENVNVVYNATSGNIEYEINNPATNGTVTAEVTNGNWLTLGEVSESAVAFTCSANEAYTSRPATVVLTYTYGDNQTTTATVTVTQAGAPYPTTTYTLATSIESGRHYIIIANGLVAAGAQNGDFRVAVDGEGISVDNGVASISDYNVYDFVINGPDGAGYYTIYDQRTGGFLVGGNKKLQLQESSALWNIEFDDDEAIIKPATGDYTDYSLQYNSNSPRFACYSSSQTGVSLYVKNNETEYTYVKDIVGYGTDHAVKNGWYLIASPVANDFTPSADNGFITDYYDLYRFDQSADKEWQNQEEHQNDFDIESGRGYLYASSTNTTLVFAGTPYNGDGQVTLHKTTDAEFSGWNLVGNPFSSNAKVDKAFCKMNSTSDGINVNPYAANSVIASMEGVFVLASAEGEKVTFTATTDPVTVQQSRSISLDVNRNGEMLDRAIVSFNAEGSLSKLFLSDNTTKLYFRQGQKDYAIVASANENELPVSFKASRNDSYTLTVNTEDLEMNYLHLIDNMTGMDVDLLATPSYTFDATTNDYTSRFRLVFSANNVDGPSTGSGTFAFYSNGNWVIGNEGEATLQVIDVNGRIVSNETINGTVNKTITATPGVYMLRLVNGNEVKTQKIVVK